MKNRKPFKLKNQQGLAMIIALIALAGMMIAAASLIRSSDVTNSITGNIAARNATAQANDSAILQAQTWLIANAPGGGLNNNNATMGYYSSSTANTTDWTNPASWSIALNLGADTLGNTHSIIIQRLCTESGVPYNGASSGGIPNQCALRYGTGSAAAGNSSGFGAFQYNQQPQIFYRIIAQSIGVKGITAVSMTTIAISA